MDTPKTPWAPSASASRCWSARRGQRRDGLQVEGSGAFCPSVRGYRLSAFDSMAIGYPLSVMGLFPAY